MQPFLIKKQKVKVTCILRQGKQILLLRSNQVTNPEHQPREGYFGIPCFTVSFGEDPSTTIQNYLFDYFEQPVENLRVIDIRQYITNRNATQIFEIIYTADSIKRAKTKEQYGKFLFVSEDELDAYMFEEERKYLRKYLHKQ